VLREWEEIAMSDLVCTIGFILLTIVANNQAVEQIGRGVAYVMKSSQQQWDRCR
jgi:hypothetical protein